MYLRIGVCLLTSISTYCFLLFTSTDNKKHCVCVSLEKLHNNYTQLIRVNIKII